MLSLHHDLHWGTGLCKRVAALALTREACKSRAHRGRSLVLILSIFPSKVLAIFRCCWECKVSCCSHRFGWLVQNVYHDHETDPATIGYPHSRRCVESHHPHKDIGDTKEYHKLLTITLASSSPIISHVSISTVPCPSGYIPRDSGKYENWLESLVHISTFPYHHDPYQSKYNKRHADVTVKVIEVHTWSWLIVRYQFV